MENSFKFYRNTDCQYFPCHEGIPEESFNCLFCYCPLYFIEDCGGNKSYYKGIKDCTNCRIPHGVNSHDYMNKKIMEENQRRKAADELGPSK